MAGPTKRVVKPVTKKNFKKGLVARLGTALAELAEVKRSHAETSRMLRDERNTLRAEQGDSSGDMSKIDLPSGLKYVA